MPCLLGHLRRVLDHAGERSKYQNNAAASADLEYGLCVCQPHAPLKAGLRAIEVPAIRRPQVIMIAGLSFLSRLAIDASHDDNKVFGRNGTSRGKCRSHQDGSLMISARLVWFVRVGSDQRFAKRNCLQSHACHAIANHPNLGIFTVGFGGFARRGQRVGCGQGDVSILVGLITISNLSAVSRQ